MNKTHQPAVSPVFALAIALLVATAITSLCVGIRIFAPGTVFTALFNWQTDSLDSLIVWSTRLPRMAVAFFVGAALGLAGAILQTLTGNILADPGLLGINSGAALAVVVCVAFLGEAPPMLTLGLASVTGACATGALVYMLSGGAEGIGKHPLRLVLAGAVIMLVFGSLLHVLHLLLPNTLEITQLWLAGSVADRPNEMLPVFLPGLALMLVVGVLLGPTLSTLVLSPVQTRALGINLTRLRVIAVAVAASLCGLAVSLAGPLAFVGLIAPHAARGLLGPKPNVLFPLSLLIGATLVIAADTLARIVVAPSEWPLTVLLAIVGVPVYLSLLKRTHSFK